MTDETATAILAQLTRIADGLDRLNEGVDLMTEVLLERLPDRAATPAAPAPAVASPQTAHNASPTRPTAAGGKSYPNGQKAAPRAFVGAGPMPNYPPGADWQENSNGDGWTTVLDDVLDVEGNPVRLSVKPRTYKGRLQWSGNAFGAGGMLTPPGWQNGDSVDAAVLALVRGLG